MQHVIFERRFRPSGLIRQSNPQLHTVQAPGVVSRDLRVLDAPPRGHQVDLAGNDVGQAAHESWCSTLPAYSQLTVCSPGCGCGRASMVRAADACVGPKESAKHQAPIRLRARCGTVRRTTNARCPPNGTSRGWSISGRSASSVTLTSFSRVLLKAAHAALRRSSPTASLPAARGQRRCR